jgi:hypothetical protein
MSITATIATGLPSAISSYAARLHKHVGGDNHIVSPLGAWMLLALCARGSDGRLRDELTKALGMDVDLAANAVASLLEKPHPAVASGAGIWTSREVHAEDLAQWLAQLPVPVDRGEIPGKATLDQWAAKRTLGMIREFPLQLSPDTVLVLATALATKVSWSEPFERVSATELAAGKSEWSRQVKHVLKTPPGYGHVQFVARTDRAGDICAHTVTARESMVVTSVIAERDVPPADVIATAYDLAVKVARERPVDTRSLYDLPLGDSPLWTITEERTLLDEDRKEVCTALLPAWSREATHDLAHEDLGFPAAAAWLAQLTRSELYDYTAKQSVVARYNRKGFEAAALSAFGLVAGMKLPKRRLLRRATLRFGHPFAVVAVTRARTDWETRASGRLQASPFWYGLPIYSAWVTVPSEVEREGDDVRAGVDRAAVRDCGSRWPNPNL